MPLLLTVSFMPNIAYNRLTCVFCFLFSVGRRAQLEEEFKKMDKDGSGKLNRNEVKRLCQEVGLKLSDESLDALIDAADHNKDGEIGYDEFLQAWFNSS